MIINCQFLTDNFCQRIGSADTINESLKRNDENRV